MGREQPLNPPLIRGAGEPLPGAGARLRNRAKLHPVREWHLVLPFPAAIF